MLSGDARRRPRPAHCARGLAVLALVGATGCGTTVPLAARGTSGLDNGARLAGSAAGVAGQQGSGGPAAAALPGGQNAPAGAVTATGPLSGATSTFAGVTDTTHVVKVGSHPAPVRVGFEIIQGGSAALSAITGVNEAFGDGELEVNAVVKDLNARGGVGGRPIIPVFGVVNVAQGESGRQAACASMIQDGHASFIVTVLNISSTEVACAAKAGVPIINVSFGAGDSGLYKQYPGVFFSPSLMNLDRELRLVVDALVTNNRISPSTKVGVLIDGGDPIYQRVYDHTVNGLLTQHAIPHEPFVASSQADINGAVLRFKTDGVKEVVFIAPSGIGETLFMEAAEQQMYRPGYGIGDSASGNFIDRAAPRAQIMGLLGAGSLPISNVQVDQYPTTKREATCLGLMRAAGEADAGRRSSLTATIYCEAVWEFTAVGTRVTGLLNPTSFRAAYANVGASYVPTTTFRMDFANGLHDNAGSYRLFGYRAECSCIGYLGPVLPIPN